MWYDFSKLAFADRKSDSVKELVGLVGLFYIYSDTEAHKNKDRYKNTETALRLLVFCHYTFVCVGCSARVNV